MKHLVLAIITLFVSFTSEAQTRFKNNPSWDEVKKEAALHKKLIFLDAYTDWCGWCKVMDRNTFANDAVGGMMNRFFVNVKYEMEKEETGKKIALKYAISAYPTFLVFNEKGELIYQIVGYQSPEQFLNTLMTVIVPENQVNRPGYSNEFSLNYPEFYLKSMGFKGKKKTASGKDINAWFLKNNDLSIETNWTVFKKYYSESNPLIKAKFWTQKKLLDSLYGKDLVADIAENLLAEEVQAMVDTKNEKGLDSLLNRRMSEFPENKSLEVDLRLYYYSETGNWLSVNKLLGEKYKKDKIHDLDWWNGRCWDIFERCDNQELILNSLIWMDDVCKQKPIYNYLDTYAALLFKAGKLDEAEAKANEAIALAVIENTNYDATTALLEAIKAKKSE